MTLGFLVMDAYNNSKLSKKVYNRVNYSFIVYNHKAYEGHQEDNYLRVQNAISIYRISLNQNNGIKEKDILKILFPIGFPINKLDTVLIATLNSFGAYRGEITHKGISQISKLIGYNYFDENVLKVILPGIKKIDQYFISNYGIS